MILYINIGEFSPMVVFALSKCVYKVKLKGKTSNSLFESRLLGNCFFFLFCDMVNILG